MFAWCVLDECLMNAWRAMLLLSVHLTTSLMSQLDQLKELSWLIEPALFCKQGVSREPHEYLQNSFWFIWTEINMKWNHCLYKYVCFSVIHYPTCQSTGFIATMVQISVCWMIEQLHSESRVLHMALGSVTARCTLWNCSWLRLRKQSVDGAAICALV